MEKFDYSDSKNPRDQKPGRFATINSRLWEVASHIVDHLDQSRLAHELTKDPTAPPTPEIIAETQSPEPNPPEQTDPHINGTRKMLLNYAHPKRLATANPEFNKIIAAISLYDGEGPIEEIVDISGVPVETITSFQTRGIYHIEENENGSFVTSPHLLGVNPEQNILFTAFLEPDTSE